MKVLITGGLGFIGSNLSKKLVERGDEVIIIDNLMKDYGGNLYNICNFSDSISLHICDIRNIDELKRHLNKVDIIFNLASQIGHYFSIQNPIEDLDINTVAQLNFLELIRKICPEALIIYTSTRQVYGIPIYKPVDEKHPINPPDINGINKFAAEQYHLLYHRIHNLKTVVLRLTNTYGPRMRIKDSRQTFLGIWIRNLIEGKVIQVFGDGKQKRDFNYVDDVIDALILSSENERAIGRVFNIGSNTIMPLSDLATEICKLKKGSKWSLVPFPKDKKAIDIGNYYSDFSLANNLLKWEPKTSLKDGLKKTLNFYNKNLKHYI
tara:strand:+ start:3925 stop:4890 length:966 start_codon:yes stop_codon:yes gene_type:complete